MISHQSWWGQRDRTLRQYAQSAFYERKECAYLNLFREPRFQNQ